MHPRTASLLCAEIKRTRRRVVGLCFAGNLKLLEKSMEYKLLRRVQRREPMLKRLESNVIVVIVQFLL